MDTLIDILNHGISSPRDWLFVATSIAVVVAGWYCAEPALALLKRLNVDAKDGN